MRNIAPHTMSKESRPPPCSPRSLLVSIDSVENIHPSKKPGLLITARLFHPKDSKIPSKMDIHPPCYWGFSCSLFSCSFGSLVASSISFAAERNSRRPRPIARPISGRRLGPKMSKTTPRIMRSSVGPKPNTRIPLSDSQNKDVIAPGASRAILSYYPGRNARPPEQDRPVVMLFKR